MEKKTDSDRRKNLNRDFPAVQEARRSFRRSMLSARAVRDHCFGCRFADYRFLKACANVISRRPKGA